MRIIIEIRERKKRPKLADFIAVYREKKNEAGASQSQVKAEFQNKFRMLYGEETEVKAEDRKFDGMMVSFNRLQDQLSAQQQQLSSVIKQVNALIDHRDKKENQLLRKDKNKDFKKVKKLAADKRSNSSGQIQLAADNRLDMRKGPKMNPIQEEELSASARDKQKEQELRAINEGYTNKKDELLTTGTGKAKPGAA